MISTVFPLKFTPSKNNVTPSTRLYAEILQNGGVGGGATLGYFNKSGDTTASSVTGSTGRQNLD